MVQIIRPSYELLFFPSSDHALDILEKAGRTCYKSEDKISPDSKFSFVKKIINSGHLSVLEHCSITVKLIVDRGVSHELVRHRLASYSQESTRYCNYRNDKFDNEITVIEPHFFAPFEDVYVEWKDAMRNAEAHYFNLLEWGASPQEARTVLPNSLKTEVVTSANFREWRHIFEMRCQRAAHPQIRQIMLMLLCEFAYYHPVVFEDLYDKFMDG